MVKPRVHYKLWKLNWNTKCAMGKISMTQIFSDFNFLVTHFLIEIMDRLMDLSIY